MDLTEKRLEKIRRALSEARGGMTQKDFAAAMGRGKSWATRFLAGQIQAVSDGDAARIEEILGIRFLEPPAEDGTVAALVELMGQNPAVRQLVRDLLEVYRLAPPARRLPTPGEVTLKGQVARQNSARQNWQT